MPLEFTLSSIWSTSRMKVFLQISGPTSFFVYLYLCIFLCISFKGHQKSSSFWIFDQIFLKEFLRQNVGHVVSRWIYRVARQCTMCHMPPIREGQLVVQHTWASILGFLPPSPELSCPIYVYTQQSLKKYATLIKNDGRSWCGDRLLGLSWSWFPFWSGLAIRPFVVVSII